MRCAGSAISVFSGIGGLDLGARISELDVSLATDLDADAARILERGQGTRVLCGDIRQLLNGALQQAWPVANMPRIQLGGPPCTPFSHAGFWLAGKRNGADPAVALLNHYHEALRIFRPSAFVLENVPGLTFKTHRRFLDSLIRDAESEGYRVSQRILSAADFGVPQRRRRLFVVGVRGSHAVDLEHWPRWPLRTAHWALSGLAVQRPERDELPGLRYRHLLAEVPPGGNYLHFTAERGAKTPLFRYRGRYWSFLLKLDPNRPAHTLPAQRITYNGPFHWENRHLRLREIARLQSFPDWNGLTRGTKSVSYAL